MTVFTLSQDITVNAGPFRGADAGHYNRGLRRSQFSDTCLISVVGSVDRAHQLVYFRDVETIALRTLSR